MRWVIFLQVLLSANYIYAEAILNNRTATATNGKTNSLDLDDKYRLFWSLSEEYVTFEVQVRTSGWIGFGLSDDGRMTGADIVIGGVRQGQVYFRDYHATGNTQPEMDEVQSYDLLSFLETDGETTLKFGRKINTCDHQDYMIKHGITYVIFAYGDDDPDGSDVTYHGPIMRGSASVFLLDEIITTDGEKSQEQDDMMRFDLRVNDLVIPRRPSYYYCKVFKIPPLKRKHHIVKIEQDIEDGHRQFIHHVSVHACPAGTELDDYLGAGIECFDQGMMTSCIDFIYSVAAGTQPLYLPDEAGIPIGENNSPKYYKLELHYNNVQLLDLVDSFGVRMYYTDVLRLHDMGTFIIRKSMDFPPFIIPPNTRDYFVDSICGQRCTKEMIPDGGINIIIALLHMHKTGSSMYIKHVRNGEELPEIARDDNFEYSHQLMRTVTPQRKVLPGDELIATCIYNTMGRTDPTIAGWTTQQEMCVSILYYYPKMKYDGCVSRSDYVDTIRDLVQMRVRSGEINQEDINMLNTDTKDAYFYLILSKLNWDEEAVRYLQDGGERNNTYHQRCHVADSPRYKYHWTLEQKVKIDKPFQQSEGDMCPASLAMVGGGSCVQMSANIMFIVIVAIIIHI